MDDSSAETRCDDTRIRTVEASHISDLIRMGEATNLSPWSAQSYLEEMKNADAIMLRLVGEDNSTIGFVVGRTIGGGDTGALADAEIYNIAVSEDEQRRGCGQQLFDAFASICRQRQVGNIWLEVRESNEKAIGFYKKNGFTSVQTRGSFYDNPREHAILMKLILK
jgi:ribosomal-protein-alanine N-acetyltransferase